MRESIAKIVGVFLAVGVASSCTNTKMMEFTYLELDTVKTQQQELLQQIDELSRRFDEERAARLRAEADHAVTLQELRELVEALSYRAGDVPYAENRSRTTPPDTSVGFATPDPASMDGGTDADKLFKNSYMDLTLGNYDLAIQGFKNFLVRYPNETNSAGAHYYLGESYYAVERYVDAVAEFQTVVREQSRSRYAAPSYLKSGFCYRQLGETTLAERAFRELISIYPRSEEAEQARLALQDQGG
jgi:tol-pal system protein YbgF